MRHAIGWKFRRSNGGRGDSIGPGAHPSSCTMGTGVLSRGYSSQGMELTTQANLA